MARHGLDPPEPIASAHPRHGPVPGAPKCGEAARDASRTNSFSSTSDGPSQASGWRNRARLTAEDASKIANLSNLQMDPWRRRQGATHCVCASLRLIPCGRWLHSNITSTTKCRFETELACHWLGTGNCGSPCPMFALETCSPQAKPLRHPMSRWGSCHTSTPVRNCWQETLSPPHRIRAVGDPWANVHAVSARARATTWCRQQLVAVTSCCAWPVCL